MDANERLKQVMSAEGLSAKQFADQINISASTLSNIFGGRNNPSLELLQKVSDSFPLFSPEWIFMGKGPMYRQKNDSQQPVLIDIRPTNDYASANYQQNDSKETASINQRIEYNRQQPQVVPKRSITKIMVFYDDGTFEELRA